MSTAGVLIPFSAINGFEPAARQAIMSYIESQMGALMDVGTGATDRPETGLAKLNVSGAKAFLNNCNEKSMAILAEIVKRDGDFMMSHIGALTGDSNAQLKGAWAGLTKRVRTVTGDPSATLLGWFKEGGDWHGIMAAQTVASMRVALAERA
ncbi:hypothetical protein ASE00_07405 [Sphingomonas sp. Root710]|uniref:hypothetical protein n=1 Tax=Sphingomonas sp. Root710 TaxID=1736594 RepID=UPI0007003A35|nr:hypothetical protein [Sphingomonas sp. Root710]KRB86518.1 hypothetical protein ASE00_07405 [Sphingomonas sp. Root710]